MVVMAEAPKVDCRECLNYPGPKTTGKVEDFLVKTDGWTKSFCGTDECVEKAFTPRSGKTGSVDKGATDGIEQESEDTNDSESEE